MTDSLTDERISELAEALAVDKRLPALGLKLGFRPTKVDMYMSNNKRNDSFEGTTAMLFDWKRKTKKVEQIPDLVKALSDSGLVEFVDEFFPEGAARQVTVPTENPSTSASNVGSKSSMDRLVKEKELMKLAGCLPADSYSEVAINLGVGFTEHDNIRRQNASLKDANFKMLMKWKCREDGGKVKDLDKALNEASCGGLVYKD
eukprot:XP_011682652.1 PREDICTED: uncharacterized protein LOC105446927 isoform X1 [Strongylocentrotus purpuratus]